MKNLEISDVALVQFSQLAGLAGLLELQLRLLANKENAIEEHSFAYKVSRTEQAVVDHFTATGKMTQSEAELLKAAREIRNKFLHGCFDEAVAIIEVFTGQTLSGPAVKMYRSNGQPGDFEKSIKDLLEGKDVGTPVNTLSVKDAGHFGWLLQAFQSGAFQMGAQIIKDALTVIDRLTRDHAQTERTSKEGDGK